MLRVSLCNGKPPLVRSSGPNCCNLIRLFATLFSGTLSCQSFLHALLLSRFEIKGVAPDLLDDVLLLHLALEATKGILQRLALLQSNLCQSDHLPTQQP